MITVTFTQAILRRIVRILRRFKTLWLTETHNACFAWTTEEYAREYLALVNSKHGTYYDLYPVTAKRREFKKDKKGYDCYTDWCHLADCEKYYRIVPVC